MKSGVERLVLNWPGDRPLAAVRWADWGIAAAPRATYRLEQNGRAAWIVDGAAASPPVPLAGEHPADLRALLEWGGTQDRPSGGWIGWWSYDLGRVLEPAAAGRPRGAESDRDWPLVELHWCPDSTEPGRTPVSHADPGQWRLGRLSSRTGRAEFEASVARAIEHIAAGDVYQVNLAHRLSACFSGRTRDLFRTLCAAADPRHGAYVESASLAGEPRRAVVSASPELFLEIDPLPDGGSRVVTRPMKGTRPASGDPRELDGAPKDRAELTMIVDLMRNDLGRLSRTGSVRVAESRSIERHGTEEGGVWQATATVVADLPAGVGIPELLSATFPPGSVTGAPKISAMQIIDELEPVRRGPYCGSIGWIGNDGHARLNVAIRTALVHGEPAHDGRLDSISEGILDYSVGAGIVADSNPASEWQETLDKAGILRSLSPHPLTRSPTHPLTAASSPAASPPAAGSTPGTSATRCASPR